MKKAITKEYQTSNTILDGDLTEVRIGNTPIIYRAQDRIRSVPCRQQCALYNAAEQRCNGFCYRWSNCDSIIFKLAVIKGDNVKLVETEYANHCRLLQEEKPATNVSPLKS